MNKDGKKKKANKEGIKEAWEGKKKRTEVTKERNRRFKRGRKERSGEGT